MSKYKILLIGIFAALAIIMALFIFFGTYTHRLADPYVRSLLEETSPAGHRIEYGKIRVNLLGREIIVRDVKISPDTTLGEERVKMEIECSTLRLTEFRIRELLFNRHLIIGDLIIADPDVRVILPMKIGDALNDVKQRQAPKPSRQILKEIFLDRIKISGGMFKAFRLNILLASSEDINFEAQSIDLQIDSLDQPVGYTFGDVSLSLRNIALNAETGLYDMKLGMFEARKKDSLLVLEGFKMIPKYNREDFSDKLQFQDDRFDLSIGRVEIAGVGLEKWLAGGPLTIGKVLIDSLEADIYRDKNVAFDPDRFPPFFNESFLIIPVPLFIDTLSVNRSKMEYSELAAGHPEAGTIVLEDFSLQSYDLTNQVTEASSDRVMQLSVGAMVMGEGPLNLELTLPLEGDLHAFTCSGSVGAMQLSPLNAMLEPSINMKFNEGRLNRMTFSFAANDNSSEGWMEFLYRDLDVELMKKDRDKKWGFVSDVANWVALSNNPAPGKDLKIVKIGFVRDKNKGIINYIWKTLQSGMIHTILPVKKQQINRKMVEKSQGREKKVRKKD